MQLQQARGGRTRAATRVSIIINNFNYARFLPRAIESALEQTYGRTEVIVVDDGSTDQSRHVVARYERSVRSILKENGGQASAFNAGFADCSGDIVIFLDADDELMPDTAQQVANCFELCPSLARVQYRVEVIDENGAATGMLLPPSYCRLANGDLRRDLTRLSNYAWPPTSGHAFAGWCLRRLLPMPEAEFRVSADYYLLRASALLGPVASLNGVGARYRSHAANSFHATRLDLLRVRRYVDMVSCSQVYLRQLALQQGGSAYPKKPLDMADAFYLAHCLVLLRLKPDAASAFATGSWRLVGRGILATLRRSEAPLVRLLGAAWFLTMAVVPARLAPWLAELFLYPETRHRFHRLLPR